MKTDENYAEGPVSRAGSRSPGSDGRQDEARAEIPRTRPPALAERRFAEVRERLRGLSAGEVFDFIYHNNLWGSPESISGLGSQLDATARLRSELPVLLQKLGVKTLVDIPCGDFSWLSTAGLPIKRYIGADIVPAIAARNAERFKHSHPFAEFHLLDLTRDPLPGGDALLCRDCLVHLPFAAIAEAFRNMARSQIRYALLTTFVGNRVNTDIELGDWRPLNLEQPPFCLPPPEMVLLEGCTEEGGAYADKALGVWSVEDLEAHSAAPRVRRGLSPGQSQLS
jgi:hypothetical protein